MLQEDISVIGTTVITSTGEIKGEVIEYSLDDDYNIVNLTVKDGDEIYNVPIAKVTVLAKKYTVINALSDNVQVKDISENHLEDTSIKDISVESNKEILEQEWLRKCETLLKTGVRFNKGFIINGKQYNAGTVITKELLKEIYNSNNDSIKKDISALISPEKKAVGA